jgi:hypothetical protein
MIVKDGIIWATPEQAKRDFSSAHVRASIKKKIKGFLD